MVLGFFHLGSGMGNQLFRYVATRVLALDKGYDFSMIGSGNFKGQSFMNLVMGGPNNIKFEVEVGSGKIIPLTGVKWTPTGSNVPVSIIDYVWEEKTPYYNPEFNFIKDNIIIDGEFQDERYFEHRMEEIDEWLTVESINIPEDVCVIGFRGGEFYTVRELGLPKSYFEEGIALMRKINPNMKFEVHTDDEVLAKGFFPDFKIIHDIGINWRSMRCAKYAIVANSSFYILPRLLRHHSEIRQKGDLKWKGWPNDPITIAPRYWDRYNIKKWERPYNYYKSFKYI